MPEIFNNEMCIVGTDDDVLRASKLISNSVNANRFKHVMQFEKLNILHFITSFKLGSIEWSLIFNLLHKSNIKTRRFSLKYVQAKVNLRDSTENTGTP